MFKKPVMIGLFLLIVVFSAGAAYGVDLTGTWNCNDGGTYYVRQIGDEVWWYGEKAAVSPFFANTAHGKTQGVALVLDWADVPKGATASDGLLIIVVNSANSMDLVYATGSFSGTHWSR
jgi:hypothetical protein